MCDSKDGHQCCPASPQKQCAQIDTNCCNWFEIVILIQLPHKWEEILNEGIIRIGWTVDMSVIE